MNSVPPHHPDMKDDDPASSGLMCFMDKDRECGADCMAYLPDSPEGTDYTGQQWSKCHLLVNAHRTGKHLAIVANIGDTLVKKVKLQAADAQRLNQPTPPSIK